MMKGDTGGLSGNKDRIAGLMDRKDDKVLLARDQVDVMLLLL